MKLRVAACALASASLAASGTAAQTTSLDQLLRRTAVYVQTFVDNLANVVAEEEYRQEFRHAAGRRRLKSDFLLVRHPGEEKIYITFRDVLEKDGKPVRDQQERLTKLFLDPFDSAVRRAGEIQRDGLRHSLERGRLMDPLGIVAFLQAAYQENFKFSLGPLDTKIGPDARELQLVQIVPVENRRGAIEAKAWISESSGRVFRTLMRSGPTLSARLTTTTFGRDRGLGIDVPIEMRDSIPYGNDDYLGIARYSNFRRFAVRVEEHIETPPTPR